MENADTSLCVIFILGKCKIRHTDETHTRLGLLQVIFQSGSNNKIGNLILIIKHYSTNKQQLN